MLGSHMLLEIVLSDEEVDTSGDKAGDVATRISFVGTAEKFVDGGGLGFLALGFPRLLLRPFLESKIIIFCVLVLTIRVWCRFLSIGVDEAGQA